MVGLSDVQDGGNGVPIRYLGWWQQFAYQMFHPFHPKLVLAVSELAKTFGANQAIVQGDAPGAVQ